MARLSNSNKEMFNKSVFKNLDTKTLSMATDLFKKNSIQNITGKEAKELFTKVGEYLKENHIAAE